MSLCERFEQEGLLKLEQGESFDQELDQHINGCADCRVARRSYQTIIQEMNNMQEQWKAPRGWQERVWQTIAVREQKNGWSKYRSVLPALSAVASIAVVFLLVTVMWPTDNEISIDISIEPGGSVTRGVQASSGDKLIIDAAIGETKYAEVLIYRNDNELVLRCSDKPPCNRRGNRISAELYLERMGSYQPMLVLSESTIPEHVSDLDQTAKIILESGARVELAKQITVN